MAEMSDTRLYLGNLPRQATKKDVEDFFKQNGHGEIQEIKLMNGFGFIEYSSPADARDIVPIFHGKEFMDSRLTVQFARGPRPPRHEFNAPMGDRPPRPRRTAYRMNIAGLPTDTSWQDLKDFARKSGVDVVFSEVSRNRDGSGMVEFETGEDLRAAIDKLDNYDFKGARVSCTADDRNGRGRSRSPPMRGGRNFSPRGGRGGGGGYSPRGGRGNYSPPPRGEYRGDREFRDRSPYMGGGGGGGGGGRGGGGRDGGYGGGRDDRRGGDRGDYRRDRSPPRGGPPADDRYPPRDGPRDGPAGGSGGGRFDDAPPQRRYQDDGYKGDRGGEGGRGGYGGGGSYGGGPRGGASGGGGRPSPPRNRDDDYNQAPRSGRY